MSEAFRMSFPNIRYTAEIARRKLLQMPLVCMTVGDPSGGKSLTYLLENLPGMDFNAIHQILINSSQKGINGQLIPITKQSLNEILLLAQSDREKELIRYTAFVAGRFTPTSARKNLGLEDMRRRVAEIDRCVDEAREIREAIDEMAEDEIRSLAVNHGLSGSEDDSECTSDSEVEERETVLPDDVKTWLIDLLEKSKWNWFEFVSQVESRDCLHDQRLDAKVLGIFYTELTHNLSEKEMELAQQSYMAFKCDEEQYSYSQNKIARMLNSEVITDSESDDLDLHLKDKELAVRKKIETIKRSAQRRKAKRVAERRFLQRSYSKQSNCILERYPDIGEAIEEYVQSCNVGADAWRRTGVLTFDGNTKVKQKATYKRIQLHLEEKYGQPFGYGTVVELCIARNKRRKSSQRYKGVAKVTSRRSRKGFNVRYNPDTRWSSALYRGLTFIQFSDGNDIININRDDAAGFRLDTLFTHKQHSTLSVEGKEVLGTRTDYVNKYKSLLQTTNYNLNGTKTTGELCAGVVKAHGLYPKNPAQHVADMKMLLEKDKLQPAFLNPNTNAFKTIIIMC